MSLWDKGALIAEVVSRDILLVERASVPTLNDLPELMVGEATALAHKSKHEAIRYLRFFVKAVNLAEAEDFVHDVLLAQQAASSWRIRDCLWVPDPMTSERLFASSYWGTYAPAADDAWFQIPHVQGQHPSDAYPGCIGIFRRARRYWEVAPAGLDQYFFPGEDQIAPVALVDVSMKSRRWLARMLSWKARAYVAQATDAITGKGLLSSLSTIDLAKVTVDARVAAEALAREARAFGTSELAIKAGYLGPDEWYA